MWYIVSVIKIIGLKMQLREWIREQGVQCQECDIEAGRILDIKVRTIRAIRHGVMNPSPRTALRISETVPDVSFRECFNF